jgi:hypothetical protein
MGGSGSDADAAMAAGGLLDYLASQGYEQVQELETAVVSFDLGGAAGAESRAITEDTEVLEYANVTVTVTRSLDDKDTATPTDDVLTVTRRRDYGFEADYIEVLVRPLKPTADATWNSFDNGTGANGWSEPVFNRIDHSGTVERSLDAVQYASGTVAATWALVPANNTVYAETIVKEMTDVVRPDLVRRTTITQAETGDSTMTREREVDGTVVESYTVGTWTDPDTAIEYPMIIRQDGGYAVIIARGNRNGDPRIVQYYSDDDTLVAEVTETRSAANGAMVSVRTSYDETGAVTGQHTVSYSINYRRGDEDSVAMTRIAGGRQRTVTITESGEVYMVTVRGQVYRVRVSDRSTVEFLDSRGSVYMTAGQNPDGSWTIASGGESRTL